MELEEFRIKVREALSCAKLGNPEEEMSIWATFEKPLTLEHRFLRQGEDTIRWHVPHASGITLRLTLTPKHQQAYLDLLHQKLKNYQVVVERNLRANRFYQRPTLELEQAQEMVKEALKESFLGVRESYQQALIPEKATVKEEPQELSEPS